VKQFFNAAEIARIVKVDRATVTRWIEKGLLEAERFGKSRWRILFSSYQKLVKQRK